MKQGFNLHKFLAAFHEPLWPQLLSSI